MSNAPAETLDTESHAHGNAEPGTASSSVRTWPADRFYWTISDAPLPRSTGRTPPRQAPPGVLSDLASDVPADIETLHAIASTIVATPSGSAMRTVIIAAPRDVLDQARSEGAVAVVPDALPDFVAEFGVDPASLNLLVGDFEPTALKAQRTRTHVLAAGVFAVLAGLVALGLYRRAESWNHRAERARQDLAAVQAAQRSNSALSLTQELDRVRRINQAAAQIKPPSDAPLALAELLSAWPAKTAAKPQSLNLTASEASLSVVVEGDPSEFLKSFKAPPGWLLDEPRINTVSGVGNGAASFSRISLRLTKTSPAASTSSGSTGKSGGAR